MTPLLVRFAPRSLWHFIWGSVLLSCPLSLLLSYLIHDRITWDYPLTAFVISLAVSTLVVSLIARLRDLERALAESSHGQAAAISDKDKAEAALHRSEARFRGFMDQGPTVAWMKDEIGRHVYINGVFARRFVLDPEQSRGKTDAELFPPDVATQLRDHDRLVLSEGRSREFMEVVPGLDGRMQHWWSWKFPFVDDEGNQYVGGVAIDVTERRRIEAALQASEERLRLALDAAQLGIWDWNIQTNEVQWAGNVHTIFGVTPETFAGTYEAYLQLVHPQDLDRLLAAINRSIQGQDDYRIEHRILWPDGTLRWVACRGDVLRDDAGRPLRMLGTVADVTARKETEMRLAEREAHLRAILDHSPALIFLKDPAGRYLDVNRQFEQTFHLTKDHVIGRTDAELFAPAQAAAFQVNDRLVLDVKRPLRFEEVVAHPDGVRTSIVLKFPLLTPDRVPYAIGGIATDITERKRAEQALAVARDQAMEAARIKTEFLATMSHEIRTPLNGVLGMTELLLETSLTDEQRDFVGTARSCGRHLLALIEDILDYSTIEAGRVVLESRDVDVRSLAEGVLDQLAEGLGPKRLKLLWQVDSSVPPLLRGDPDRLRQVLENLLNNAVKFTAEGQVGLYLAVVHETEHAVLLRGEVTDTGIGIGPLGRQKLFQPFSQVDGSSSRNYGGTGLGLAICKRLVTLMQGDIGVESDDRGSRFWFTVRLAKPSSST